VPIYLDSTSAIAMGQSLETQNTLIIFLRRYHYVRNCVAAGDFITPWIDTENQSADIGTKQTPGPRHLFITNFVQANMDDQLVTQGKWN
jgi:hypothetical protein